MNDIPIIAATGTKGKTTTIAIIADVLQKLGENVLKVDTTGHFFNSERKSSLGDSKKIWGFAPTVAPGRYLWEFLNQPQDLARRVAVLETSLGSSSSRGLAYRYHEVGVFLNVFEDHLGSTKRLQNKDDIVNAKQFIFELIASGGYAVFNVDDEYVRKALAVIPKRVHKITRIACGISFDGFDVVEHLGHGGVVVTVDDDKQLIVQTADSKTIITDLKIIPWTFNGTFEPSLRNIMAATAAIYGHCKGKLPEGLGDILQSIRLDPYGGRLTLLRNDNGVTILADYAHDKVSLTMVARLAQTLKQDNSKVIGVVRLAHDRTDDLIRDTGRTIAAEFDSCIIYDKIDGVTRHEKLGGRFPEIVGRTSQILAEGIAEHNSDVVRIVREDEALAHAAQIAQPGDVVVMIVNDDIRRSVDLICQTFHADFV